MTASLYSNNLPQLKTAGRGTQKPSFVYTPCSVQTMISETFKAAKTACCSSAAKFSDLCVQAIALIKPHLPEEKRQFSARLPLSAVKGH